MLKIVLTLLFCVAVLYSPAFATEKKETENAALIYAEAFKLYPSKSIQELRQQQEESREKTIAQKDPNIIFRVVTQLQDNPEYLMMKKVEEYAACNAPFDSSIESYVQSYKNVVDLVHKAALLECCDWPKTSGSIMAQISTEIKRLNCLKELSYLAVADARLEAEKSYYKTSLSKIVNSIKIAHHAGNKNVLDHLFSIAMEKNSLKCLHHILENLPLEMNSLKWLEVQLEKEKRTFLSFQDCLVGEKELFAENLTKQEIQNTLARYLQSDPNAIPQITDDSVQMAIRYNGQYTEQLCQAAILPYPEAMNAFQELQEKASKESTYGLLSVISSSSIGKTYTTHIRINTQLHAIISAIKIYQAYVLNGKMPDVLPKDCPVDLFSGNSFIYERKDTSFILKCQGIDLSNDKKNVDEYEFKLNRGTTLK